MAWSVAFRTSWGLALLIECDVEEARQQNGVDAMRAAGHHQ